MVSLQEQGSFSGGVLEYVFGAGDVQERDLVAVEEVLLDDSVSLPPR